MKELFDSLPKATQMRVAEDWITRQRNGHLRGAGIGTHAGYLKMIGDEQDMTIDQVLDLEGVPV